MVDIVCKALYVYPMLSDQLGKCKSREPTKGKLVLAAKLSGAGMNYTEIGRVLNINPQSVSRMEKDETFRAMKADAAETYVKDMMDALVNDPMRAKIRSLVPDAIDHFRFTLTTATDGSKETPNYREKNEAARRVLEYAIGKDVVGTGQPIISMNISSKDMDDIQQIKEDAIDVKVVDK